MDSVRHSVQEGETVLFLGEGDFALSAALTEYAEQGDTIIATGYDAKETVFDKYPDAAGRLDLLNRCGCCVLHEVDARAIHEEKRLESRWIDLIVWSFPHTSGGNTQRDVEANRRLLFSFFTSARQVLVHTGGQVIVSLRCTPFYDTFRLVSQAVAAGFRKHAVQHYDPAVFPAYTPVRTKPSKDPTQGAPDTDTAYVYEFILDASFTTHTQMDTITSVSPKREPCAICGTAVFCSEKKRNIHFNSPKHAANAKLQRQQLASSKKRTTLKKRKSRT